MTQLATYEAPKLDHTAGYPFVIYVLHYDRQLGRGQHYIGSTTPARLAARWREHQIGRGGRTTRKYALAGIGFTAAVIEHATSRTREDFWKGAHQARRLCPVCLGLLPFGKQQHFPAEPEPKPHALSFD